MLMLRRLEQIAPEIQWIVRVVTILPNTLLVPRAKQAISEAKPDVLFIVSGSNTFAEESVAFSIRKRWPKLYGSAMKVIGLGKAVAGGHAIGSRSARGLLFRLPRAIGRKVLGMAPMIEPAVAYEATRDLFRYLETLSLPVACRLAPGPHQQPDQSQTVAERTRKLNTIIATECERLGYPYVSIKEAFGARGWDYILGPDNLHETHETRELSSRIWAELVLEALEGATPAERSEAAS